MLRLFIILMCLCGFITPAHAQGDANSIVGSAIKRTGLPLPRYASLRSDEVNMRVGPGTRYPIVWVYHRKGLPVQITAEFDTWRRIKDSAGDEGWVHQATLSGKRSFLVMGATSQPVYRHNEPNPSPRGEAEPGAMGKLLSCAQTMCKVEFPTLNGYMSKASLWGVSAQEVFE